MRAAFRPSRSGKGIAPTDSRTLLAARGSAVAGRLPPLPRWIRRRVGAGTFARLNELNFRHAVWVLPAVFAVHVLEEAPGFTDWVNRYAWDGYTNDDFIRLNGFGLAATVAATLVASRFPKRTIVFLYFALILTQQALFNTLFHAGTTVAFRAYSPGLVSALVLFLPVWYWLTRLAFGEGLLTRKRALLAGVIGGLIHTGAVAQQVFGLDLR